MQALEAEWIHQRVKILLIFVEVLLKALDNIFAVS